MLTRGWRPGLALLAASGLVSLAALPGRPARRCGRAADAAAAPADSIKDKEQWVLSMLNAQAAWSVTRAPG